MVWLRLRSVSLAPARVGHPASWASGGRLFFTADDGVHGGALWRSDGTRGGTVLVKDLASSHSYDPALESPTDVGGTLFFGADETTNRPIIDPAVEVGRHPGGHRHGEGHQPTRRLLRQAV